jgi:hypothetical protein
MELGSYFWHVFVIGILYTILMILLNYIIVSIVNKTRKSREEKALGQNAPYGLLSPDFSMRSGQGWTIGSYRNALMSLQRQIDDLTERIEK